MYAIDMEQPALKTYEAAMEISRAEFAKYLEPFFAEIDPKVLLLFWINFSYIGVGMTEPVEHWIRRAGENCKKLGYNDLGTQLCKHAIHEADHHLMMIEDADRIITQWNEFYTPKLNTAALLERPLRDFVVQYRDLHEFYISGDAPYGQIAIEYEIENLSATYSNQIMDHTYRILGEDFKDSISFIEEHAKIDVAHTLYNRKAIAGFMHSFPHTQQDLIKAGTEALTLYGIFLKECYQLARTG